MHIRRIGSSAAIIAVTMGGAGLASAAEEGAAADLPRGLISEVVVTARKRGDERLQEIPTAITAFGEDTLKDMAVNDFTDFAYQVPGSRSTTPATARSAYIMRGGSRRSGAGRRVLRRGACNLRAELERR